MIVVFIEPDKYERTAEAVARLQQVISSLVVNGGAHVFMFANAGYFDNDCYTIVTQLKLRYPSIERHYFHGGCDYDIGYVNLMSNYYDELHFQKQGIVLPCHLRNCAMIDMCDVMVTCGVALAVEYARTKKKHIINICEC